MNQFYGLILFLINFLIHAKSNPLVQQENASFIPCGMPPEIQMGAAARTGSGRVWPNGRVPYTIDSVFNARETQIIRDGMKMVEDQTRIGSKDCVKFVQKKNEKNYIRIVSETGCWSFIGKFLEETSQTVSLQKSGCVSKSTVAHEVIHALGFDHEQNRPDRDNFVDVFYENIIPRAKSNFDKVKNPRNLGTPYDFKSIMHYGENFFAKDTSKPTIRGKNGNKIQPGNVLSQIDVREIRSLYNCK